MLQELSDPRLELLVAFSLGVGAGLWMAGAPRLVTLAALSPALLVGVAIASRKQSNPGRVRAASTRWRGRPRCRRGPAMTEHRPLERPLSPDPRPSQEPGSQASPGCSSFDQSASGQQPPSPGDDLLCDRVDRLHSPYHSSKPWRSLAPSARSS